DAPSPARSVDGGAVEAAAPVLRLTDIDLSFGGIQALSSIDLTVAPGEIRAIIGPNGAGKSSLVNIISGLYRPDRGSIWLNGRATRKVSPAS
ncbi:ATP-binding cassette domain-containing protein, partial [Salmonella sp. gx-f8]|nr:ATP-binding cassette domain-containing protein [Salmonella sp. gx-f8]